MRHMFWRVLLLSFGLVLSAAAFGQGPKSYRDGHGGEVFFPVGDISFADEVVSFASGEPKARAEKHRIPEATLGIPDYDRVEGNNYLTLGCGGVLVVRFTDNSLIDIDRPGSVRLRDRSRGRADGPCHLAGRRELGRNRAHRRRPSRRRYR